MKNFELVNKAKSDLESVKKMKNQIDGLKKQVL